MGNCVSYSVDEEFAALWEALDTYWAPTVLLDTRMPGWRVLHVNSHFEATTGFKNGFLSGKSLWGSLQMSAMDEDGSLHKDLEQAKEVSIKVIMGAIQTTNLEKDETPPIFDLNMRPNTVETLQNHNIRPNDKLLDGIYFGILTPLVRTPDMPKRHTAVLPAGVELGPELGKGSFGTVYKAVWQHQIVAAKIIEIHQKVDEEDVPLELVLSSQMLHPHVVRLLTFARSTKEVDGKGDAGESLTLVMEYCNSGSLMAAIRDGEYCNFSSNFERSPDFPAVIATALEIASGLDYIHSKNIVHGDLTAHNILLQAPPGKENSKKTAKVADFGLSRALTSISHETLTHGTVTHMAPELLERGQMSKASDIYSFGVLLYELCSGQQAWEGFGFYQVIYKVTVEGRHPEMHRYMPRQLKLLMERCMSSSPTLRPTAGEVITKLSFAKKIHCLQRPSLFGPS